MAAVEAYATLKIDGRPYSYDELKTSILKDFQAELSLDEVLAKYDPMDNISSMILKEFPLLGAEDDKELLDLYIAGSDVDALKKDAIQKVTDLIHECGVGLDEIDDFIVNHDGMGLFQEFSITNRNAVADKNFQVDYKRIIDSITANDKHIIIDIDVSNLDFEHEIDVLKAKGTIRDDGTVDISRDLVKDAMGRMQELYEHIRANFNEGIGNIRHPMNDFQPTFVQRYEDHLAGLTKNIFKNLPELFLSFLPGSPVMTAFKPSIQPLKIGVAKRRGRDMKSIVGFIKNIHLNIIGVESDEIGITSLLTNGLFFKLRTCESIVASQIRGMHRYVPLVPDESTTPLELKDRRAVAESKSVIPKPRAKSAKPARDPGAAEGETVTSKSRAKPAERPSFTGRVRNPSRASIEAAEDYDDEALGGGKNVDARPFFDLYQGQLLQSLVSNQDPVPARLQFYTPVKVSLREQRDKKLEMEHVVGVNQAALLFKPECYAMTIFANLQIMSHDSNNGVASTPSIPEKLDFILRHRDVTDEMSQRTFDARLRYFLARLHAMEGCITDVASIRKRYEPYSSYKPGLDRIIYFLTHGKAFEVIEASRFTKFESMQHESKQLLKKMQSISRDFMEIYADNDKSRRRDLFKRIVDKLRHLKEPDVVFEFVPVEATGGPLSDYRSFISKMNRKIDSLYLGHRDHIVNAMEALAECNGIDIGEAIRTPLETLINHPKVTPRMKVFIKKTLVISLGAMKEHQLPLHIYKGVFSTLFQMDVSQLTEEQDRLGSTYFDPIFKEIMTDEKAIRDAEEVFDDLEDDEDQYGDEDTGPLELERSHEDGRKPVKPGFTMGVLGSSHVVDTSIVDHARSIVLAAGGEDNLTEVEKNSFLTSVLYKATIPFDNLEELIAIFGAYEDGPSRHDEIVEIQEKLIAKQEAREHLAEEEAGIEREAWRVYASSPLREDVEGGGKYIFHATEKCYVYSEMEDVFNRTGDQEAYDYLCRSWKLVVETEKAQPFMTKTMQILISKKLLTLMRDKENDALNEVYLTHYDRHDEPELKSLLRRIYDYFTLQGIFVPMTRDERIMYSLQELLAECISKKIEFMEMDGDVMSFDNAYANILCIQIFGKPITIMIDDLSNGKLPIPYGIQNHLCHDPFYPETFTVTFNVLKCLTLALPQCVSLVTYVSYVNLLVGESFLHNLYTDRSFSIVERIHDSFFDKMKRMEINDRSGDAYYLPDNRLSNFFTERIEGTPEKHSSPLPVQELFPPLPASPLPVQELFPPLPSSPLPSSPLPDDVLPNLESPLRSAAASGGTKRNRRYKQKTKRNQTLSKRFKKNRTRRLHGLYIRN